MIKSNNMASTVSHAENCLYELVGEIQVNGSTEQREVLHKAFVALEELYFLLQEEE